mgnify:CR=1 FL=1
MVPPGNREIVPDHPLLDAAEDVAEPRAFPFRDGPMEVRLFSGSNRETAVEVGDEGLGEEAVRFLDRAHLPEPHFFDEPVLQRLEKAFDPALGLGREREDEVDPDGIHGPFELCLQIGVVPRDALVHFVGGEPVEIDALRQAVFLCIGKPKGHDRQCSLVRREDEGEDFPGGVVDRGQEAQFVLSAPALEPVVV